MAMAPPAKKRIVAAAKAAENQAKQTKKANQNRSGEGSSSNPAASSFSSPVTAAKPADGKTIGIGDGEPSATLLEQHRETMKKLQSNISELRENADDEEYAAELHISSTLALSRLKSLHRSISLLVEARAEASARRREEVEERGLVLENLKYERKYLRGEIASMKGWRAVELEKMAWSELGVDPSGSDTKADERGKDDQTGDVDMGDAEKGAKAKTAEEAIDTYLFRHDADGEDEKMPKSHRDPANHACVLKKLQSDLVMRSSLVEKLSQSKAELKDLQKKRDELRNFLNQIPKRVAELEKAGEGLNNFFGTSSVWKDALHDGEDESMSECKGGEGKVRSANLLVNRPSCDRARRFGLARSNLPSPLYVLFVQLVGYKDAWASLEKLGKGSGSGSALDEYVGASGMDVVAEPPVEGNEGDRHWSVSLTLSPTDILPAEVSSILGKVAYSRSSTPSTAAVNISFYFSDEQGVVLASVNEVKSKSSCENEALLDNLFPGDDGLTNPNISLSLVKDEKRIDEANSGDGEGPKTKGAAVDKNATNSSCGKPYYWCQVLSGLTFPPPPSSTDVFENTQDEVPGKSDATPFQIQTCTKAVFRQLLRRIRARKTLAVILDYLGKRGQMHPLPIHPAMRGKGDQSGNQPHSVKAKLHSWVEDSKESGRHRFSSASHLTSSAIRCYVATIKRKTSTLKAIVAIDLGNYPAEPPVWYLQNEDGSLGSLASRGEEHRGVVPLLHNSANNNTLPPLFDANLHRIECHVNQELGEFIRPDVETTYDWILIHQLADIISCWDEVMSASEASGGARAKGGEDGLGIVGQVRARKGRDRRLVTFGEKSPFFLYRNGL